jgi:ATP-binding cassette subfamily B protein
VAALAMVARAYGRHHSVEALRERMQIQQQGASLHELKRAALALGFHAHAVRIGLDHLAAVRLPAIAHLRDGHYVTLFEVSSGNVVVGDPATGIGRWTVSAFQRSWSGQLLLITPA